MKQRQTLLRAGILVLLVAFLGGILAPYASAAADDTNPDGAFNVVVSPSSVGLETKPGVPVTTDIRVQNHGLATEHVKVTVMKFTARGQDGTPELEDLGPGDDFANWAQFSTTQFDAQPNVWQDIKMTISPPKTAAFGYYYAVIFSRSNVQPTAQKQANLLGAVASLVLLDVQAPGAVRQAQISQFSIDHNSTEFLPVNFTVRIHNTGNTHVADRGNIIISKGGKTVDILEVNYEKGYILPNTYRKFTAAWADGAPVYDVKDSNGKVVLNAKDQAQKSLDWSKFGLSKLRFGKYNAKLVMVFNNGQNDVSNQASLNFWVVPWRILGGIAIVVFLILAGLWATILRPAMRRIKQKRSHV